MGQGNQELISCLLCLFGLEDCKGFLVNRVICSVQILPLGSRERPAERENKAGENWLANSSCWAVGFSSLVAGEEQLLLHFTFPPGACTLAHKGALRWRSAL